MRASRRTRIVRRGELVRVAQLALVLEVVDSARAHQVGGHVDALATPAAVGRGSQWSVMRCSHARRAGSGRAAVGSGQGGQAHPSCPASSKSKRETVVVGQYNVTQALDPVFCGPHPAVRMCGCFFDLMRSEFRTAAVRNVHRISVRTAFLFGADLGNPVRDPSPGVISAPPSRFLGRVGGPSRSDPASTRAPPPEVGFWGAHFEMESEPRCPRSELTLSEK